VSEGAASPFSTVAPKKLNDSLKPWPFFLSKENAGGTCRTVDRLGITANLITLKKRFLAKNYTECGRNSELIINKNNILLEVIDINFSTPQFTVVLNVFLHSFTFCVQYLLGGHHPPQCTGAHELRSCA
jgi:hypothetical protein